MVEQNVDLAGSGTHDPAALLNRRYRGTLLAVAVVIVLHQVLIQPAVVRLTTDAPVINVAGRQRMLSQRLAKAALALDVASEEVGRRGRLVELEEVLRLWSESHDRLRAGGSGRLGFGSNSAAIRGAFDGLEPSYRALRDAAVHLVKVGGNRADLATILGRETDYLTRMDGIVGMYEHEASRRVDRLFWTGWVLTALALAGLVGIGQFIVRPAARLIQRQVAELHGAREALEERVRERTSDLERLNRELAHEVRERARAEEEHRRLVEQFSHIGRTTVVGEMATGLAHELNQPLGAIANYAEGCLVVLDAPGARSEEVKEAIGKILATTLRAGRIVQRIRRFVTRHEPAREMFDANRLVVEVEQFFRDQGQREGVVLQTVLAPDLPTLLGDSVQIQQVLVNLVRNALEAVAVAKPKEPLVVMQTERADAGTLALSVTDNGDGVSAENLPRIFDAFFSSRDAGMGMGLAISRTIVEAHQGRISVESEPGIRTTFRFFLPLAGGDDAGSHGLCSGR